MSALISFTKQTRELDLASKLKIDTERIVSDFLSVRRSHNRLRKASESTMRVSAARVAADATAAVCARRVRASSIAASDVPRRRLL